jgi:hypothetical protein
MTAINISGRNKPAYKISPSHKSKPRQPSRGWKKGVSIICELVKHKESIALLATVRKCSREWDRYSKLAEEMNSQKLLAELELCQKFGISVSDLFYVELAVEMKETEDLLNKLGGGARA